MSKKFTFYCPDCDHKFQAKGVKKEWTAPIYGPSWKRQAQCPQCQNLFDQHKQALSSGKQNHRQEPASSCTIGACPLAV